MPEVKVGQVWKDNDKRVTAPRYLKVRSIDETHAVCQIESEDEPEVSRGTTRIALKRFRPNSTGYVLFEDVE